MVTNSHQMLHTLISSLHSVVLLLLFKNYFVKYMDNLRTIQTHMTKFFITFSDVTQTKLYSKKHTSKGKRFMILDTIGSCCKKT